MLIIVEGPDLAGKSTYIKKMQKVIEKQDPPSATVTLNAGPPQDNAIQEYLVAIRKNYTPLTNTHIICDRWHLGELVYPTVFNRKSAMDVGMFSHIERFLYSRGAVLVCFNTPVSILKKRYAIRGDKIIRDESQLVQSAELFQKAFASSRLPKFYVYNACTPYDTTPEDIVNWARSKEQEAVQRMFTGDKNEIF